MDCPLAMLEYGPPFEGDFRGDEDFVLVRFQFRGIEIWHVNFQKIDVAGRFDVAAGHVGKPEQVIGNSRTDAGSSRRVPPVLDITFLELATGGKEDLFPGQ